jgi:hypothetical protein
MTALELPVFKAKPPTPGTLDISPFTKPHERTNDLSNKNFTSKRHLHHHISLLRNLSSE